MVHQKTDWNSIHEKICQLLIPLRTTMPFYNSEEERQHGLQQLQKRQVGLRDRLRLTPGGSETAQERGRTGLRSLTCNLCEGRDLVLRFYVLSAIQSVLHILADICCGLLGPP